MAAQQNSRANSLASLLARENFPGLTDQFARAGDFSQNVHVNTSSAGDQQDHG